MRRSLAASSPAIASLFDKATERGRPDERGRDYYSNLPARTRSRRIAGLNPRVSNIVVVIGPTPPGTGVR